MSAPSRAPPQKTPLGVTTTLNIMSKEPTSPVPALRLQSLYDEELSDIEARELQAALSDHDQLRLDALSEMSELVRFDLEQHTEDVALDGLWERIASKIDDAPSRATPVAEAAPENGWLDRFIERVREVFSANKPILVPAMAAFAIAALVFIPMMLNEKAQAPDPPTAEEIAEAQPVETAPGVEPVEQKIIDQPTVIVVQQPDFEGNAMGTVQYSPDKVPVIWYLGADGSASPATPDANGELPPWVPMMLDYMERIKTRTQQGLTLPGTGPAKKGSDPI